MANREEFNFICNDCNTLLRSEDLVASTKEETERYKKDNGLGDVQGTLMKCPKCDSVEVAGYEVCEK